MNVLDLFSGIGGFSLGLERAGMETVAFCEIKPYCQRWLKQQWPGIPIFDDVTKLGAQDVGSIDVICGGFPCQDLSNAGRKAGFQGKRSSLYREMLRIIGECEPRYAIFENVTGLLTGESGGWFAQFLYDLAEVGYDAEWHCIPASAVGANHHRDRVWVIAYPKGNTKQSSIFQGIKGSTFQQSQPRGSDRGHASRTYWSEGQPEFSEVANGPAGWVGAVSGYGNAVVHQIPEIIGRAILKAEANEN